jgi:ABC-type nitrate/sulfonate/bicarbonate transport system substrate-binding protein
MIHTLLLRALRAGVAGTMLGVLFVSSPLSAQSVANIRLATIPVDAGSEVYYAADEGIFKKNHLDVAIDNMSNGAAIIAAVTSNAVDIGYSNVFSLVQAYNRGVPIKLIAGAGVAAPNASPALLVVDKSSPIRTAKQLNGKTFGVDGVKTLSEFAPRIWMDKNGGDSTTVKFLELPFGEIGPALAQHRIDAAMLPEPFLTKNEATITGIADPFPSIAKEMLIGAYFTSVSWADAHPDLVRQFSAALRDAALWANGNHAESAAILAKYAKIDAKTVVSMRRVGFAEAVTPELVQPTIDVAYKYHVIASDFPASEMIYSGIQK